MPNQASPSLGWRWEWFSACTVLSPWQWMSLSGLFLIEMWLAHTSCWFCSSMISSNATCCLVACSVQRDLSDTSGWPTNRRTNPSQPAPRDSTSLRSLHWTHSLCLLTGVGQPVCVDFPKPPPAAWSFCPDPTWRLGSVAPGTWSATSTLTDTWSLWVSAWRLNLDPFDPGLVCPMNPRLQF